MNSTERTFQGVPVSPGIAIGRSYVLDPYGGTSIEPRPVPPEMIEAEIEKFQRAIETSRAQLARIRQQVAKAIDEKHADIFVAQAEFLNDPELVEKTVRAIRREKLNAEYLFNRRVTSFMEVLSSLEDETFKARNSDLLDVANRILGNLGAKPAGEFRVFPPSSVLVAIDLAPSETTHLIKQRIAGFVLEKGGSTSHTAIMAKALEIPAVVGVPDLMRQTQHWDTIIVDGQKGRVVVNPTAETLAYYEKEQSSFAAWEHELTELRDQPAETLDGYTVTIRANVEFIEETQQAAKHGAQGIGLFRTEFLFMNRDEAPPEDEQLSIYKQVLETVGPNSVVFRTLDFGGDKFLNGMASRELNPFMGQRAIRLCLSNPPIFRTQIRAMLRASVYGKTKILVPMISGVDEWMEVKKHVRRAKAELRLEGIPFDTKVELGPMIEVPSAAVVSADLAQESDFFSIGTNDLIQYTLAVDRGNETVAYLYESMHPAVLHLIKLTVQSARKAGISVTVCGEMASDPMSALMLLGMGVDELSMSAISIPHVKRLIRSIELSETQVLAEEILSQKSIEGVKKAARKRMREYAQHEKMRRALV